MTLLLLLLATSLARPALADPGANAAGAGVDPAEPPLATSSSPSPSPSAEVPDWAASSKPCTIQSAAPAVLPECMLLVRRDAYLKLVAGGKEALDLRDRLAKCQAKQVDQAGQVVPVPVPVPDPAPAGGVFPAAPQPSLWPTRAAWGFGGLAAGVAVGVLLALLVR